MSEVTAARFTCTGCGRSYAWKQELAGRRVKCKCGQVMTVPQSTVEAEDASLYDIAPSDESPKPAKPRVPLAPVAVPATATAAAARAPTLGYVGGPTQREKDRMSVKTLIDMKRDAYVPTALLVGGLVIYVGYYAIRYQLGAFGIAMTGLGLGILMVLKAAFLMGFAFAVAGKLGVSFGGIYTAALKLAAIAVFCDAVTTWVDAGLVKLAGPGGALYGGMFGFFIALGVYWLLLIYLFSMDPGDSWMVVVLLAVFDFIVRWVLILLLLQLVLSWGGISPAAVPVPVLGSGRAPIASDPVAQEVAQLKENKELEEAREFIAGGRQGVLSRHVEAWYAAGCKNVWFHVGRDINGRMTPISLIVELPKDKVKDKQQRAKCYEILKTYFEENQIPHDPGDVIDSGESHIIISVL